MKLNPEYKREAYHNYIIFYNDMNQGDNSIGRADISTSADNTEESKENINSNYHSERTEDRDISNSNKKRIDWSQVEKACINVGEEKNKNNHSISSNSMNVNNVLTSNIEKDRNEKDYYENLKHQKSTEEAKVVNDDQNEHREVCNLAESYELKMIVHNTLFNILKLSITYVNNRVKYAYDITAKQTVVDWNEKRKLSKEDCVHIFQSIFKVASICNEYLLNCSHLILQPEFVYYDLSTFNYYFLYYIHYSKDIMSQITELTEYVMDKINYEDEQAVLLAYGMYHESRKTGGCVSSLSEYFTKKLEDLELNKVKEKEPFQKEAKHWESSTIVKEDEESKGNNIVQNIMEQKSLGIGQFSATKQNNRKQLVNQPLMEVKKEEERLTLAYPQKCYVILGAITVGSIVVLAILIGLNLSIEKMIAGALIIVSIAGYILSKVFTKNNKVEKVVPYVEYKKPEINTIKKEDTKIQPPIPQGMPMENVIEHSIEQSFHMPFNVSLKEQSNIIEQDNINTEYTQVLSMVVEEDEQTGMYLEPVDKIQYHRIYMKAYPFFIGKITEGTDATINDTMISRVHAKITQEEELYYITDLGSTNGTYVNETVLQPHTRTILHVNDRIRFANCAYFLKSVDNL